MHVLRAYTTTVLSFMSISSSVKEFRRAYKTFEQPASQPASQPARQTDRQPDRQTDRVIPIYPTPSTIKPFAGEIY